MTEILWRHSENLASSWSWVNPWGPRAWQVPAKVPFNDLEIIEAVERIVALAHTELSVFGFCAMERVSMYF